MTFSVKSVIAMSIMGASIMINSGCSSENAPKIPKKISLVGSENNGGSDSSVSATTGTDSADQPVSVSNIVESKNVADEQKPQETKGNIDDSGAQAESKISDKTSTGDKLPSVSDAKSYLGADGSSFEVRRLCSNNATSQTMANLVGSNNVVMTLYPLEGNSLRQVKIDDMSVGREVRKQIINEGKFKLSLKEVSDGKYTFMMCSYGFSDNCSGSAPPSFDPYSRSVTGDVNKGVLSRSDICVKDGKLMAKDCKSPAPRFDLWYAFNDEKTPENNAALGTAGEVAKCEISFSPLIIDFAGNGFDLSAPLSGAIFDINADGKEDMVSWLTGFGTYFLAFDINMNGKIDDGSELFGNATMSYDGKRAENGFLALSMYDLNLDGRIDEKDPVFPQLILWNGDMFGNSSFMTLKDMGVKEIDLFYSETFIADKYGNETRQTSKVKLNDGTLRDISDIWLRTVE
ncbi:MAG: hypothetical protein HQK54_14500 [Oligoflexales bacterium]|nr:hypothetical protein [Oligoflexales bacterium]